MFADNVIATLHIALHNNAVLQAELVRLSGIHDDMAASMAASIQVGRDIRTAIEFAESMKRLKEGG